jgi:hypothetical protein
MANPFRGWATAGVLTDPAPNVVLADSGPLPAAAFDFRIIVWTNQMPIELLLEHRNAANGATLKSQRIVGTWPMPRWEFVDTMLENERIRLIVNTAGPTGVQVQVSLWHRTLGSTR